MRYWHDLKAEQTFTTDSIVLDKDSIIEFAQDFDPQPYHLDTNKAKKSIFGGLCASGWHVSIITMKLLADTFKNHNIAFMGISSMPSLNWKIPVFVADRLTATIKITECINESSRTGFGLVCCAINVQNQNQQIVLVMNTTLFIALDEHRDNHSIARNTDDR